MRLRPARDRRCPALAAPPPHRYQWIVLKGSEQIPWIYRGLPMSIVAAMIIQFTYSMPPGRPIFFYETVFRILLNPPRRWLI